MAPPGRCLCPWRFSPWHEGDFYYCLPSNITSQPQQLHNEQNIGKILTWRQYILSCSTAERAHYWQVRVGLLIHRILCGFAFCPVHWQTQAKRSEVPWPERLDTLFAQCGITWDGPQTSDAVRSWTAGDYWLKHPTTCSNHTGAEESGTLVLMVQTTGWVLY